MLRSPRCHQEAAVTSGGSRGRSEQRWMSPLLCIGHEGASPPDRNTYAVFLCGCDESRSHGGVMGILAHYTTKFDDSQPHTDV